MYNLNTVKEISCVEIAREHGIALERRGGKFWGKIRDERTPSFVITEAINLWYDFGSQKGGSVIDLVMELKGLSVGEAIEDLAKRIGLKRNNNERILPFNKKYVKWEEYKSLGIHPDQVRKNIDFSKVDESRWEYFSQKYKLPVSHLAVKNKKLHEKLLMEKGGEKIKELASEYRYHFVAYCQSESNLTRLFHKSLAKDTYERILSLISVLNKGLYLKSNKDTINNLKPEALYAALEGNSYVLEAV